MPIPTSKPTLVLGGNYATDAYYMISASGDSQSREWLHIKGRTLEWLVLPNREADFMLQWHDTKGTSRGFAGRTLTLKVIGELHPIEGEWQTKLFDEPKTFEWQGPWSSNTDALFKDTGYDIRNRIRTWGCLSLARDWATNSSNQAIMKNLIYFDPEPQYGTYSRIVDMAKAKAKELRRPIYFYMTSYGGSSSGVEGYNEYSQNNLRSRIIHHQTDIDRAEAAGRKPFIGSITSLKEAQEALQRLIELQGGEHDF